MNIRSLSVMFVLLFSIPIASAEKISINGSTTPAWTNGSFDNTTINYGTGNVELRQQVDDYISYWRADGNAKDENRTSANDGTFSGHANASQSGMYGNAFVFDGVGDDDVYGNDVLTIGLPYSVTGWFKIPSSSSTQDIFSFGDSTVINKYYGIGINDSGFAQVYSRTPSFQKSAIGTTAYDDEQWHFITGVWTNISHRAVYIGGILEATDTSSIVTWNAVNKWCIGHTCDSTPANYLVANSMVDDVRFYNQVLTINEMMLIMNQSKYSSGNYTQPYDADVGNEVLSWDVNMTGNYSVCQGDYTLGYGCSEYFGNFTVADMATWNNQSIVPTTRFQNASINITILGNTTHTGELNNINVYTQATESGVNCTDLGSDGIADGIITVGVTSSCTTDGLNDHIEIQWALDNASSGDIVHFNAGNYTLNGTIWANNSGITIEGNGTSTKISLIEHGTAAAFPQNVYVFNLDADNQTLQDIWFYGNRYNSTGADGQGVLEDGQNYMNLIHPSGNNQLIQNLTIEKLICDGIRTGIVENLTIRNNIFIDVSHSSIQSSAYNSTIENNTITVKTTRINDAGIRIYDAYNTIYQNNVITYEGTGIIWKGFQLHNYGEKWLYNITIKNNTIMANGHHGIWFDSAGGSATTGKDKVTNIILENNIIRAAKSTTLVGTGIKIEGGSVYNNITIQSNTINGSYLNGIGIWDLPVGSTDIVIKNNIITNSLNGYGIVNTSPVTISYNNVWNHPLGNYANTSAGIGDISVDPLFVSSSDFHLESQAGRWNGTGWVLDTVTSLAIDAGDPTSDYSLEPSPNGGRINMGAYGNTLEASKSPAENDYIPPTPTNLAETNSSIGFWINHTWQAGAGNITDSFNVSVNGTWTNGSSLTYKNTTGLSPHGWANISVYAFNNSGSGTLNTTALTNNTQVPNNAPVQTAIGAKSVNEGSWLNFTILSTDIDGDSLTYDSNKTKGTLTTNSFSWLPTYSDSGTYYWTFNTTDNYSSVVNETITVTVNNINQVPPPPVINSTITGNFYINTTWIAGSGNVTNGYNSTNGTTWVNNTNTYRNNTLSAHSWNNLTIYGWNSTDNILSSTALTNNTQIPNNPITISGVSATYSITEGQTLSIDANYTDVDSDTGIFDRNFTSGSFDTGTGILTWTTVDGEDGVYNWQINVSDGYGSVSIVNFTVSIEDVVTTTSTTSKSTGGSFIPYIPTTTSVTPDTTSIPVSISSEIYEQFIPLSSPYQVQHPLDLGIYSIQFTPSCNSPIYLNKTNENIFVLSDCKFNDIRINFIVPKSIEVLSLIDNELIKNEVSQLINGTWVKSEQEIVAVTTDNKYYIIQVKPNGFGIFTFKRPFISTIMQRPFRDNLLYIDSVLYKKLILIIQELQELNLQQVDKKLYNIIINKIGTP